MKELLFWCAVVGAALLVICVLVYSVRLISQTVTPVTVSRPEPGIVCVSMVTADGVALSCMLEPVK